jgi:aspartyl-tRNA(Asn)/glutamyl-tRNA(Gln) amidotransferase subunit A
MGLVCDLSQSKQPEQAVHSRLAKPKEYNTPSSAPMPAPQPPHLPDLLATRQSLRTGLSSPAAEMNRSIAVAQSARCDKVFLTPLYGPARAEASVPGLGDRPLGGLAVSVKDLFDIQGQTTTAGSTALRDAPAASSDCPAVARLKAAGGIVLGRTNMVEFAFSGVGINPHFGTPANAADHQVDRIPGGSRPLSDWAPTPADPSASRPP